MLSFSINPLIFVETRGRTIFKHSFSDQGFIPTSKNNNLRNVCRNFSRRVNIYLKKKFLSQLQCQLSKIVNDSGIILEKKGKYFVAHCPFHKENSASFFVDDNKGVYHCFGCGASGNIFSFERNLKNEFRSNYSNVLNELQKDENDYKKIEKFMETKKTNKKLFLSDFREFTVVQLSCFYFFYLFKKLEKPKFLLNLRNVSTGSAKIYEIGFSSEKTKPLCNFLINSGYSLKEIIRTGVVISKKNYIESDEKYDEVSSQDNYFFFDMFRNRLIIPIRNADGLPVGFGGRLTSKIILPKYLNSSESEIFKKKKNLFSQSTFKESVKKPNKIILVVEGYLDTIALFQNGVRFSVASLGTTISINQIKKFKNCSINKHALICFDSDQAGKNGILRLFEKILFGQKTKKIKFSVAKISERLKTKDPDDYLQKYGSLDFTQKILNESNPTMIWFENLVFSDLISEIFLFNEILSQIYKIKKIFDPNLSEKEIWERFFSKLRIRSSGYELINLKFIKKNKKKIYNLGRSGNLNGKIASSEIKKLNSSFNPNDFQKKMYYFLNQFPVLKYDSFCIFFSTPFFGKTFFEMQVIKNLTKSHRDIEFFGLPLYLKKFSHPSKKSKIEGKKLFNFLENFFILKKFVFSIIIQKKKFIVYLFFRNLFFFLKIKRKKIGKKLEKLVHMNNYQKKKIGKNFTEKNKFISFSIQKNIETRLKIISRIDDGLNNIRNRR